MVLLEPITFLPSSSKQSPAFPMAPEARPWPTPGSNPGLRSIKPKLPSVDTTIPGIDLLSRSDPPTPPRGPPPTPKRRPHNELSKADPPTPPRAPPPTPCRRGAGVGAPDSLSRRDPPTPPRGPPPTPARREFGGADSDFFSSLSREDPPTPPSAPPPTPTGARRALFRDLSKCDPPTPPSAPPPSPQRRRSAGIYSEHSRNDPPTPPSAPPPTPGRSIPWTTQETNLLVSVRRSGVKLGWFQISGLFGRSVFECRNKYRDVLHQEVVDLEHECYEHDYEHSLLGQGKDIDDNSRNSSISKYLSISTRDSVPGLSRGPSPVGGSPVVDSRVTTKRSWGQIGDVECADERVLPYHSCADDLSSHEYCSSKKAKTITNLSDELNFVLTKQWPSNVMDRVQEQHATSQYSAEKYWSPSALGFELVQMPDP